MNIHSHLMVLTEAEVSSVDGTTTTVHTRPPMSGVGLGTFAEFLQKAMNHLTSVSSTLVAADAASGVALAGAPTGMFQGMPFSAASGGSATPGSGMNTGSATIRKILVTAALSGLPVASSLATTAPTLQFVYGSLYSGMASTGAATVFDSVPMPRASGGEIAVGVLNVPNTFTSGDNLSAPMMVSDKRATQGVDLVTIIGTPNQP